MKILHIWDQAGVACVVAKHHRRAGHEVTVLKRAGYDPFGIFHFYGERLVDLDGKAFLKRAIDESREYDVIHVHSLYKIIPELRKKYPAKKLILHYHGSEVRKMTKDPIQKKAEGDCNCICGSTQDLAPYVASTMVYIPNPVDTEHFRPQTSGNGMDGKAFTFRTTGADSDWVLRYLKDNGFNIDVEVLDRAASPIQYSEMPRILSQYSIYVDLKYIGGTLLHALSKTALESLACGLRVLDHRLRFMDALPREHCAEAVADRVLEAYQQS